MTFARRWFLFAVSASFAVIAGCDSGAGKGGSSSSGGTLGSAATTAPAAVPSPADIGVEKTLFNGKDLTGWVKTECETEIKDGVLLLKSGEGWIHTERQYTNFELTWECRNLKKEAYDSGVHFRAVLPTGKAHWPKKFQVNLQINEEGNLTSIK